jgi:hypothetical protein
VDDNFEKHKNDEKAKIFLFLNKAYKGDVKAVRRYFKILKKNSKIKKIKLNNDSQHVLQFQQKEQPPLSSNH